VALSAVTSVTVIARTVFGNKRIVIADVVLGNDTWPSGGLPLTPAQLRLDGIELCLIEGKKLCYFYNYTTEYIDAYLPAGTTGAAYVQVAANGATPNETVRLLVIGYGG